MLVIKRVCVCLYVLTLSLSAYSLEEDPVAKDDRIQKQPPHHWGTPAPNSRVKLDFVPYRMLASVRHEQSTKHLPRSAALQSASTPAEIILAQRLKESISTKKLGEVYTEQGYEDKKYDHGHYEKHRDFNEKYENHDRGKTYSKKPTSPSLQQHSESSSTVPRYYPRRYAKQAANENKQVAQSVKKPVSIAYDNKKYPYYKTAPKNSPIRYATNPDLLPDKQSDSEATPFYDSTNYKECPEIKPELNVGPDNKHKPGEPRLKGLGEKIDCLTSKYFGEDPFDNPFFKEEDIGEATENPAVLLPSATSGGPVLIKAGKKQRKRKVANTEYIEGLLPPPLTRNKRGIEVYSTRRGGVKFSDLQTDGSDVDARLVPASHRVSASNKFGARESSARAQPEGRTRARGRSYEVTEEPEEPAFATTNRFANRNAPPRRVHVEHHRVTKEEVYSSTYVPAGDDAGDVMTTTVWNAAPEIESITPRSNFEQEANSVEPQRAESVSTDVTPAPRAQNGGRSSRTRSRPSVAAVREDAFELRGERRKVDSSEKSNTDVLRSRSRTRVKAIERPVENTAALPVPEALTQQPQDVFIVPTEAIPQNSPTESYETVTTERTVEKSGRQRPLNNDNFKIPTEKIPEARQPQSQRVSARGKPQTAFANAAPAPVRPAIIPNAVPVPLDDEPVIPRATESERGGSRRQQSQQTSPRSRSGRLEAIKGRKQDYTARIPVEASRHTSSRSRSNDEAPQQEAAPTRTRQRSRVSPIDPVENVEPSDSTTRRVNRQGSRTGRRNNVAETVAEPNIESAPSSRRSSSSRRAQSVAATEPQPEIASPNSGGSSTRRGRPIPVTTEEK